MKGVYILLLGAKKGFYKSIGSLGRVRFEKGNYAYVGSARSALFPRIERHFKKKGKRVHWHIDYLTTSRNIVVREALYASVNSNVVECRLSSMLASLPYSKAVRAFGSSDCIRGCKSHLYFMKASWEQAGTSIQEIFKKEGLRQSYYWEK